MASMAGAKRKDVARLKRIYSRQREARWGADYLPSIFATPAEAPSVSRPSILTPAKLGRDFHALSIPERTFALLALYCPSVVDIHEQKMLHTNPAPHPTFGFPGGTGQCYQELPGLIAVADKLGLLGELPKLHITDPKDHTVRTLVVPYIGDFLLYFRAFASSEVYCVNWSVKDKLDAFKRPTIGNKANCEQPKDVEHILIRHQLEEAYYKAGNIRTIQVAAEQIPKALQANLEMCFVNHRRKIPLSEIEQDLIISRFRAAIAQGIPPSEILKIDVAAGRISVANGISLFFKSIWERKLRVDMFHDIFIDYPVLPEKEDVLDRYAGWFAK